MKIFLTVFAVAFAAVEVWTFFFPLCWADLVWRKKIDMGYVIWILMAIFVLSPLWASVFFVWSIAVSLYVKKVAGIKIDLQDPGAIDRERYSRPGVVKLDAAVSLLLITVILWSAWR